MNRTKEHEHLKGASTTLSFIFFAHNTHPFMTETIYYIWRYYYGTRKRQQKHFPEGKG